jgi:SpoVK/Ycf46/Vps4 family AAA+-type ATPase
MELQSMASADHLRALIKSHIEGDDSHFFSVAMQVAAHEAKLGRGKLAEELRDLIDKAKAVRAPDAVPIVRPRGDLAGLFQVSYPTARLADMALEASVVKSLMRIIKEQRHISRLRSHGLSPRRKILLMGPPGTGKTMTASVLAGELGIPLFVVRLEALITKFMGETAAKLRQVFDALARTRGVYLFDEFDAIGGNRGMANDVGEARRTLNSFLSMIEQDDSHSLIIAATNHPEILDSALFRRFDDVIEYSLPAAEQVQQIVRARLGSFAPSSLSLKALVHAAAGLSHAEVARAIDDSIKDAVMHERSQVKASDLAAFVGERRKVDLRRPRSRKK